MQQGNQFFWIKSGLAQLGKMGSNAWHVFEFLYWLGVFSGTVPHTIKPIEVGQGGGSAGRTQKDSCLRFLPLSPPSSAAFPGSWHSFHQPLTGAGLGHLQVWEPRSFQRGHGSGCQAAQLRGAEGAARTWGALLLVPAHPQHLTEVQSNAL